MDRTGARCDFTATGRKNLEFDNSEMNWQFMAEPDVHGPLYDQLQGVAKSPVKSG